MQQQQAATCWGQMEAVTNYEHNNYQSPANLLSLPVTLQRELSTKLRESFHNIQRRPSLTWWVHLNWRLVWQVNRLRIFAKQTDHLWLTLQTSELRWTQSRDNIGIHTWAMVLNFFVERTYFTISLMSTKKQLNIILNNKQRNWILFFLYLFQMQNFPL